jgi:hypothetical protein
VDFATCTDDQGETFDALIKNVNGELRFLDVEFLDVLMALDPEALEHVWQLAELLLARKPGPEAISA